MAKILLVTSRLEALNSLVRLLHKEDFSVHTATAIATALGLIEAEAPHLILCDLETLPWDGYQFLQAVREQPLSATIPFVFMTMAIAESDRRRGMNLGADDYLVLPCNPQDIVAMVHCRLARQQAFYRREALRLEELRRNLTIALPHELRTPLQGIITSAELLNEYWQTLDQEDIADITHNIMKAASRLNQLVQKFLDYFKLDLVAGDLEQCRQWRQQGIASTSKFLIQVSGEKLATQFQRDGDLYCELCEASIAISQKWLTALVEELLDNAFKFSQPELVGKGQKTVVEVKSYEETGRWVLRVRDYGRGMTDEEIKAVGAYMQFKRMQYEQQGAGLGLAIAERIVKIYNGTMTISSTSNEGTLVTISLPLHDDSKMVDLSVIG